MQVQYHVSDAAYGADDAAAQKAYNMDYDLLLPYSGETLKIYGHRQHGNIVLAVLGQALHTAASTLQLLCDLQVINHCCDLPAVERQDTMQCVDVCCPPCLPGSMACCAVLCCAVQAHIVLLDVLLPALMLTALLSRNVEFLAL